MNEIIYLSNYFVHSFIQSINHSVQLMANKGHRQVGRELVERPKWKSKID